MVTFMNRTLTTHSHPVGIVPLISGDVPDFGGGLRTNFSGKTIGIRFLHIVSIIARFNEVLIQCSTPNARHKAIPNTLLSEKLHGRCLPVPFVEVPYDGNTTSIRRPDSKKGARNTACLSRMSTQFFVGALMRSFCNQMKVVIGKPMHGHLPASLLISRG